MGTNFQLLNKLSEDQWGILYEATDLDHQQKVLVKIYSLKSVPALALEGLESEGGAFSSKLNVYKDNEALYAVISEVSEQHRELFSKMEKTVIHRIKKKKQTRSGWPKGVVWAILLVAVCGMGIGVFQGFVSSYFGGIAQSPRREK